MMSRCSRPRFSSGRAAFAGGACAAPIPVSAVSTSANGSAAVIRLKADSTLIAISDLEHAGAVAEFLGRHTELVERRGKQVRHPRVLRELQVASALQLSGRAAREHDRQRAEVVLVAVAQRAAIEHQRVIELRPIAVWSR